MSNNKIKAIFPIGWENNTASNRSILAQPINLALSNTALFYGSFFNSAGWLTVFKNTTKYVQEIDSLTVSIGTAQTKVLYKTVFGLYRKSIANPETTKVIQTSPKDISKHTHICTPGNSSKTTYVTLPLDNKVIVKPNQYFYAGIITFSIPSNSYFNFGVIKSKTRYSAFYTQNANINKNITWYRSGNANDNTWLQKYQLDIRANCSPVETQTFIGDAVQYIKTYEDKAQCKLSKSFTEIEQGTNNVYLNYTALAGKATLMNGLQTSLSESSPELSVKVLSDGQPTNRVQAELRANERRIYLTSNYANTDYEVDLQLTATYGTATTTDSITITFTKPEIISFTAETTTLRLDESTKFSIETTPNVGKITYKLSAVTTNLKNNIEDYVSLSEGTKTLTIKSIDLTQSIDFKLTATASNGQDFKDIPFVIANTPSDKFPVLPDKSVAPTLPKESKILLPKLDEFSVLPIIRDSNNNNIDLFTYPIILYIDNPENDYLTLELTEANYRIGTGKSTTALSDLRLGPSYKNQKLSGIEYVRIQQLKPISISSDSVSGLIHVYIILTLKDNSGSTLETFELNFYHKILDFNIISQGNLFSDTYDKAYSIIELARNVCTAYDITQNDPSGSQLGEPLSSDSHHGELGSPKFVGNEDTQNELVQSLQFIKSLAKIVNNYSRSLLIIPYQDIRTFIAKGHYIMADDQAATLADGRTNTFKKLDLAKTHTASPYKELLKAIKILIGPVEYKPIYYKSINAIDGDDTTPDYEKLYF